VTDRNNCGLLVFNREMGKASGAGRRFAWMGIGLCLALLTIVVVAIALRNPKPPQCLVLQRPYSKPLLARDQILAHVPGAIWASWLPRIEAMLFGQRKPVSMEMEVVSAPAEIAAPWVSKLSPPQPELVGARDLRVWFLPDADLKAARRQFEASPGVDVVNHAGISSADGIECSLFTGQTMAWASVTNEVGLRIDCFTRVHEHSFDLTTDAIFTEAFTNHVAASGNELVGDKLVICTNFDLAVRLQVPRGSGVLLLQSSPSGTHHHVVGLFLTLH